MKTWDNLRQGILLYMSTPQQVSDSFKDRQAGRTISGARNIAVTNRKKAANDNQKGTRPRYTARKLPSAANDNHLTQTWLKKIETGLQDQDIDDLEDFLELYGDKLNEKTRGIIGKALLARKYYKVSLLNLSIISWGMTLWLLQFKLALVSVAAFGLVGAIDYIEESTTVGKLVIRGGEIIYDTILDALSAITGSEINFDPGSILIISILLPFSIGLTTLLIMSFQYQLTFVNCFSGKGAEYKMMAFIFAIFGYFTPILNLFPWFIFWLLAVWRYPK